MQTRKVRRNRRSNPRVVPAPVGGLNKREGLANMPELDAFTLTNFFPDSTIVRTRRGCEEWAVWHEFAATPSDYPIESLFVGGFANGQEVLYAASNGELRVAAGAGVSQGDNLWLYTAVKTGLTSNRITAAQFSNANTQYVICVTGADTPFALQAPPTAPTTLTITGSVGGANLFDCVMGFKGRLFFSGDNNLGFHYLAVGAIQGAASYFDLAQVSLLGGGVLGMAAFSHDSGNGLNDYCVFMTNRGEYIVYGGTDPANASTWSLVGRYYAPPPIGRKGWFNFRSDLYVMCEEGILSFAQIMKNGENGKDLEYISSKLGNFIDDHKAYRATHGWCAVANPRGNMLIVNIPNSATVSGEYVQYVMNTDTFAWCQFVGWDALCWAEWKNQIFYGTSANFIMLADTGYDDNGVDIVCACDQAYNYFDDGRGGGNADKHFHFATVVGETDAAINVSVGMSVNYITAAPDATAAFAGSGVPENITVPVGKLGYTASISLQVTPATADFKWYATRIISENSVGIVL